jgi:uroporphyrinogen-III decarboxylase
MLTDRIRAEGKYSFVHLDGTLNPLLRDACEAGYDVIEGVTPAPAGDLEFDQLRSLAGRNTILWGGIPCGMFSEDYPLDKFVSYVTRRIQEMVEDGRSVLAAGDQVVPGTRPERILLVNELVEKYGSMN